MKLLPEEKEILKLSPRCEVCGHLDVLHQLHSCGECLVMDCDCAYEPEENEFPGLPFIPDRIEVMINGKVEFIDLSGNATVRDANKTSITDDGKHCPRCKCLYDDMMKGLQGRNGACECDCGHKSPKYLRTNN